MSYSFMLNVLTGPVHSGKTSLLRELVRQMELAGLKPGGFLSVSRWDDTLCQGYDLLLLRKKTRFPFIERAGDTGWERTGPFFFVPETLKKAKTALLEDREAHPLIVDEIGPLEISGKGFWPSLEIVLFQPLLSCIVVVRESLLNSFLRLNHTGPVHVCHVHDSGAVTRIMQLVEMK